MLPYSNEYVFMLEGPLVLQEFAFKNTVSEFSEN